MGLSELLDLLIFTDVSMNWPFYINLHCIHLNDDIANPHSNLLANILSQLFYVVIVVCKHEYIYAMSIYLGKYIAVG